VKFIPEKIKICLLAMFTSTPNDTGQLVSYQVRTFQLYKYFIILRNQFHGMRTKHLIFFMKQNI